MSRGSLGLNLLPAPKESAPGVRVSCAGVGQREGLGLKVVSKHQSNVVRISHLLNLKVDLLRNSEESHKISLAVNTLS